MSDNVQHAYEILVDKCNAVIEAKYIMSGNAVIGLLRYLASTPCLMDTVARCNQGFRYREEFDRAGSGAAFRLPESDRKIVALVTGILFDIDRGRINFNAFLMKNFYGDGDYETSYRLFGKTLIEPYAKAFGKMINQEDADVLPELEQESKIPVGTAVKEQIFPYIAAINEVVENDAALSDERKREFLLMTEGLTYAFEIAGTKMIRVVWTGMRSVFAAHKPTQSYLRAMEKILAAYAVI